MSVRNAWMEASSRTIDRLMHTLQEIQLSNSSPNIPFNLIFGMIRGSANEILILQSKVNELNKKIEELTPKKTE